MTKDNPILVTGAAGNVGGVYEITGPRSINMNEIAKEYETALNRSVKYVDVPYDEWLQAELVPVHLPEHVFHHISTRQSCTLTIGTIE